MMEITTRCRSVLSWQQSNSSDGNSGVVMVDTSKMSACVVLSQVVLLIILLTSTGLLFLNSTSILYTVYNEDPTLNLSPPKPFLPTLRRDRCFLVFVIPSLPDHVQRRELMRATSLNTSAWQSFAETEEHFKTIKVMFIIGQVEGEEYSAAFLQELEEHDDIFISEALLEEPTVLKYKVLWGMKRSLYLYQYDYLVKTDDDILVNLPGLVQHLVPLPRHMLYTGACHRAYGRIHYSKVHYPSWHYCSGGGYVLSRDLVQEMDKLPQHVHQVQFRPEDAYTGWLVYNVNKYSNYTVRPETRPNVLNLRGIYRCGPFKHWFYHYMVQPAKVKALFARMHLNATIECEM